MSHHRCGSVLPRNSLRDDVKASDENDSELVKRDHSHRKRNYRFLKRPRRCPSPERALKKRRAAIAAIDDMSGVLCCARYRCFAVADPIFLNAQKRRIMEMSRMERKDSLKKMLSRNRFVFDSNIVCTEFLVKAFGFSRKLQSAVKELPSASSSSAIVNPPRMGMQMTHKLYVLTFLQHMSTFNADKMPDSDEVHLPYVRKLDLYMAFRDQFKDDGSHGHRIRPTSYSYFIRIWREYLPHIKVRKVRRFSKCGDCEDYRSQLEKAGMSERQSAPVLALYKAHHKFITTERMEYYLVKQRAAHNPSIVCSLIIDGADQSAFGIPHFTFKTKTEKGHAMKVRLVGVLDHGVVHSPSLFLLTEQFETGANHIVEVLHRVLSKRKEKGKLPPILHVQMDNCSRENKNRFTLGYLEFLVMKGVFVEANASFLPVGHTHEDIDQMFSRTSTHLRVHDAVTLEDMAHELRRSFTPNPSVSVIKQVANFSGLLSSRKYVKKSLPSFTQFRYFKFTRSSQGGNNTLPFQISLSVKMNSEDDWKEFPGNPIGGGMLETCPDIQRTPATKHTAPENWKEVGKRLSSTECRINSRTKLQALYSLRDDVYRSRYEPFHWNISTCPELNGDYQILELNIDTGDNDGEPIGNGSSVRDLNYEVNEFVAVKTNDLNCPFWIGQILKTFDSDDGVIFKLELHWYQKFNASRSRHYCEDLYRGRYNLSFISHFSGNDQPWTDVVSVSTVLVSFPRLTADKRLPVAVQKQIRASLQ